MMPYLVMVVATMIGAIGAFYLKQGAERSLRRPWRNWQLLLGIGAYGASLPVYLLALSWLPVSVAYPMTSMTYVWSALLAKRFLNEGITRQRMAGIALIIGGITLVAL